MRLIVDTCNVLHRTGILPPELAGVDERSLATLVNGSRYGRNDVLFVCDGTSGRGRKGRSLAAEGAVSFQYAGPHMTADELILKLVAESSSPRQLVIVSSDRQIGTIARRRRCRVIDSDTFLEQLALDASRTSSRDTSTTRHRDKPLAEDEVEEWMDHFGLDEDSTED